MRAFARQAQGEARGDGTALVLALDRRVREAWGEFESFPLSIVRREELLVTLSAPYMAYRRGIVDVLRTKRPIEEVPWTDAVVVSISPARLGAPDIEAVTLTRAGREIDPLKATLRPMTFANGSGEQGVLHAGDVHFPTAAFLPGVPVTLTLRPRGNDPIEYAFSESELATMK